MTIQISEIAQLMVKEVEGVITSKELAELYKWRNESPEHEQLYNEMHSPAEIEKQLALIREGNREANFEKIKRLLLSKMGPVVTLQLKGTKAVQLKEFLSRSSWKHEVIEKNFGMYEFKINVVDAMDAYALGLATAQMWDLKSQDKSTD